MEMGCMRVRKGGYILAFDKFNMAFLGGCTVSSMYHIILAFYVCVWLRSWFLAGSLGNGIEDWGLVLACFIRRCKALYCFGGGQRDGVGWEM